MTILIVLLSLFGLVYSAQVRYDGFQVHRITPKTQAQIEALRILEENVAYDFWTDLGGVNKSVDVMVPPHLKLDFEDFINLQRLTEELYIDDVQDRIDRATPKGPQPRAYGWTNYYRLNETYAWLDGLAATYNEVTTIIAGSSYQGRQIKGIHISFSPNNINNAIFFECGIHAREWISPAVCTFIANQILTTTDEAVRSRVRSYDWYIVPIFNPDGYEYSHTNTRLWRKTRTPYGSCFGADANRNWGYRWNTGGSSSNPCSDTYAGPSAFSETSTRTTSEYITSIQHRLVGYFSIHSYSQYILLPYGHTSDPLDNFSELNKIGLKAARSLAVRYGTQFRVGNIVALLYVATGGSVDWVKASYGTRMTYIYELRDTGRNGFILPPEEIIPSGWETLDSVVTILDEFDRL